MVKCVSILGSTGSIGRQTLDIIDNLNIPVAALTAGSNVQRMEEQCRKYRPQLAVMSSQKAAEALKEAIKGKIQEKDGNLVGKMISEGTTPRRLTDLIGSLCDLTSGSGDKGTPIVLIQGYFDNYTND